MHAIPERERFSFPRYGTKAYDFLFALPLIAWYALDVSALLPLFMQALIAAAKDASNPFLILDAAAQGATLIFLLLLIVVFAIRKPATSSAKGAAPKAVALLGTFLGLVIMNLPRANIGRPLMLFSTLLILGGTSFVIYALLWLGRSMGVLSEARTLVTGGPYAWVRHPMYLGEEMALIGITLQFISPAALFVLAMQIGFQLYRMSIEERVMRVAFPEYADYARRVKKIIPGIF
jgi:protein-S-isoprenylcysteine O-methyltransferase Ste14